MGVKIEAAIAGGGGADVQAPAICELERFDGVVEMDGDCLRATFKLESPSVKRAARAALVIFGRIAGQAEPTRFEVVRI